MPEAARPFSHVVEFANDERWSLRSWNAPAAMYFVISVLPISMTSGVLPPARVASNFWRCVPHVWYCTVTVTPGWLCSNWEFAADTIGAQFAACASVWSQTVMLFAAACSRPVTEAAAEAATASVTAITATAMVRPFIEYPHVIPDGLFSLRPSGDQDGESAGRLA